MDEIGSVLIYPGSTSFFRGDNHFLLIDTVDSGCFSNRTELNFFSPLTDDAYFLTFPVNYSACRLVSCGR